MSHQLSYTEEGDILRWEVDGSDIVTWPPERANAPVDFGGIILWVKSAPYDFQGNWLNWREDALKIERQEDASHILRRGPDWELELWWNITPDGLEVTADTCLRSLSTDKCFQIEYQLWVAKSGRTFPAVTGWSSGTQVSTSFKPYGEVKERFFDSGSIVEIGEAQGRHIAVSSDAENAMPHFYRRGNLLKLGTSSEILRGNGHTLRTSFTASASHPECTWFPPTEPTLSKEEIRIEPNRSFEMGLMLHLQYAGARHALLREWMSLARDLGYDFILLELNRALRCHPKVPDWAWSWESLEELIQEADQFGLQLVPGFNLLGHQNETGLLAWHPEWRETHYDAVCPSHPEVRAFAVELIRKLVRVFHSDKIFVGGDEVRYPADPRPRPTCRRCGPSVGMEEIVDYWNHLAREVAGEAKLLVAADMFLPQDQFPKGITANNTDGKAAEYLKKLDSRIILKDWQYGKEPVDETIRFLTAFGHPVILVSGQYHLENPFLLCEATQKYHLPFQIQTTWASPRPGDIPLEAVAAGALAHSVDPPSDPKEIAEQCRRIAQICATRLYAVEEG